MEPPICPDISDILQRKAEGRKALAKLSFVEKVQRMEALRERLAPLARRRSAASPIQGSSASSGSDAE